MSVALIFVQNFMLRTMVIGSFPVGKLFIHGVKRISKPFGDLLIWMGKHHPFIRRYVIIPPAQLYNTFEVRSKLRMLRLKQPRRIPRLSTPIAIRLGADMLSEAFVFGIGMGLIYYEVLKTYAKSQKQNQEIEEQKRALDECVDCISADVERNQRDLNWIKAALRNVEK
ncbi:putative OPA3-like protein CG43998 [Drosophila teissieri]|uniref:putative OPA3-like protein CG43998 n=1 Tax=Drosophila teissieri TaxID=7243 RepID=UPI001CBA540A|nr:putative OPA3-like protein CG43998 [Drosophila teissieri]